MVGRLFTMSLNRGKDTAEDIVFNYTDAPVSYDAEPAMGTYTLSLYDADVFVIPGVDVSASEKREY